MDADGAETLSKTIGSATYESWSEDVTSTILARLERGAHP